MRKLARPVAVLLFLAATGCVVAAGMALAQRVVAPYFVVPESGPGGTVIVGCGSVVSPQEPRLPAKGNFVGGSCDDRLTIHREFAAGSAVGAILFAGGFLAWQRRVRRTPPSAPQSPPGDADIHHEVRG